MAKDITHTNNNMDMEADISPGEEHLDRKWAWVIMVAALMTHILTFGASYASVGALYVEFLNDYGQSESATALAGSIMIGTMLCSGPLASILVAKFGARAVGVCGGIFASSGLILSAFANGLVYLYFTFGFLTGLGYGFSYLPCIVMVGNFFEKRRSVASGIAVSGSGLGTFVFAPIVQSLLESIGYRNTLITLGGIELILCVCGATYIPSRIPVRKNEADIMDIDIADIGSGSVLTTASILDGSIMGKSKTSDMSIMLRQAALCSRSMNSSISFRGKSRSHVTESTSVIDECIGAGTPPRQLSVDGSVLAQAALCLSRLSPSISSAQSSSSKVSENAVTPVVSGSPITSTGIPEDWIDNMERAVDNNEDTLVRRHKPEFPPIPEEFISPSPTDTAFDANDSKTTVIHAAAANKDKAVEFTVTKVSSSEDACSRTESESNVRHVSEYVKSTEEPAQIHDVDIDIPVLLINGKSNTNTKEDDDLIPTRDLIPHSSSSLCIKSSTCSTQSMKCLDPLATIGRLFKIRFFILFCLSNLLVCIGYQLPYMYFKAFALSLGLGDDAWAVILAVMGVMDTLGRVLIGFCFDYVRTDAGRLSGFAASMVIAGIILCLTCLADTYVSLLCFAGGFALVAGSTDSLVAALLVGFVGLDTLGYSFGMSIEMQGIGFIVGPPIAGFLYGVTKTYSAVFLTGGVAFILSGLVLLPELIILSMSTE